VPTNLKQSHLPSMIISQTYLLKETKESKNKNIRGCSLNCPRDQRLSRKEKIIRRDSRISKSEEREGRDTDSIINSLLQFIKNIKIIFIQIFLFLESD
jgi:hypothetical protein